MLVETYCRTEEEFCRRFRLNVTEESGLAGAGRLFGMRLPKEGKFYGRAADSSVTIRTDSSFMFFGFPTRYFSGRFSSENGKIIIRGKFRFPTWFYLMDAFVFVLFILIAALKMRPETVLSITFTYVIFPLLFPVLTYCMGRLASLSNEKQIKKLLKSL